jgi:hypothetical protein
MADQIRDHAITTLAELEKAIAQAIGEARYAAPDLQLKLSRRLYVDACEVVAAEAERIARPAYRTRRERQQEASAS